MTLRVALVLDGDATGAKEAAKETRDAIVATGGAAEATGKRIVSGAAQSANAAKLTTNQMANLQFQLQDIRRAVGEIAQTEPENDALRALARCGASIGCPFPSRVG